MKPKKGPETDWEHRRHKKQKQDVKAAIGFHVGLKTRTNNLMLANTKTTLHKKWSFSFRTSSVNMAFKSFLRIWSYLLQKSSMENFAFLIKNNLINFLIKVKNKITRLMS